jgi:Tfp pilus assembly protein PilF
MNRVLAWLDERPSRSTHGAPFFLWVHLFDPHEPHDPPEMDAKLSPTPYDGEIASVDRQIGRLLQKLQDTDRLDDTILVLTSDHGESLGEHKEGTHGIFIYEATVHVPLIFRYPRKLPADEVYRGSARSVDIMPTILGLAGKTLGKTQGTDLSRELKDANAISATVLYSESLYPELALGMARLQGIRLNEWTYIRAPRPELYNRLTDPGEVHNLLQGEISDATEAQALELDRLLTKREEESSHFALVPETRPLDRQTVEMLEALGYVQRSEASEQLVGMDPKDGFPIFNDVNEAITSIQAGDCASATKTLTAVVQRVPSHVLARNMLAKCQARQGSTKAAYGNYLKSLAELRHQPEVLLQLGRLALAQNDHESARRYLSKTLELLPDSVQAMMLMGYLDLMEGQPAKASRWYDRAIDADPARPDAYIQQGDLYFRARKFGKARAWYERALTLNPNTYGPSLQAGLCCLSLADLNAAEAHLSRAKELNPTQWQPLYGLACVRAKKGDVNAALGFLEKAVTKGFADRHRLERDPCQSLARRLAPQGNSALHASITAWLGATEDASSGGFNRAGLSKSNMSRSGHALASRPVKAARSNRVSIRRKMLVASVVCFETYPGFEYGDTTARGTRNPSRSNAPGSSFSSKSGGRSSGGQAEGGGTWSKKPPCSS